MRLPLPLAAAAVVSLLCAACDGDPPAMDAGPGEDAGPPLEPSRLFGPCLEDWQCPGEDAVCRTPTDGWPEGYCTRPCEDRTPCDVDGVYHHCAQREGEEQSYCERRCLNGIDCGRDGYSCAGELPPSGGACLPVCSDDEQCGNLVCDRYTGQCAEAAGEGAVTGEGCAESEDCRSEQCIAELNESGVPTGWVGGYCVGNCVLPSGFNNNDFYAGDELPPGTCPGEAICIPAGNGQSRGDLGRCYHGCEADADCRDGYSCLREFNLASGGVASYPNGICVPGSCASDGCPTGYECVNVTGSDGMTRAVCSPL
ncbi:MAG TPA: hypothetical protein RMH99_24025 [Sandaracinaceae bacterium LLY-WYZ-13_1]|nr:hypothetical protein [Sandaracinaceae bacterium LLY-WYZ-13_1]